MFKYNPDINVYSANAFGQIVREFYDMGDRQTTRFLSSCTESVVQTRVLGTLSKKIYDHIVAKTPQIDYGSIPKSKGDITKIENYDQMMDCLEIIDQIIDVYRDDHYPVAQVKEAVAHLQESKSLFEKGFIIKEDITILTYNNIALAIVSATSLLLSTCIDYISDPKSEKFTMQLDKVALHKSKNSLLLKNLIRFNDTYRKGQIKEVLERCQKVERGIGEGVVSGLAGIATAATLAIGTVTIARVLLLVLPIIHELVSTFYNTKQRISDYFEMQSVVVAMNAERVRTSDSIPEEDRYYIYKHQMEWSNRFKKISRSLAVKYNQGQAKASRMIEKESEPVYKVDDSNNTTGGYDDGSYSDDDIF